MENNFTFLLNLTWAWHSLASACLLQQTETPRDLYGSGLTPEQNIPKMRACMLDAYLLCNSETLALALIGLNVADSKYT